MVIWIIFVIDPIAGIVLNVFTNAVQIVIISDNMFIMILTFVYSNGTNRNAF